MFKRFLFSLRGDKLFNRVLVNSGWLLGSGLSNAAMQLVQGVLVARFLGVELFGVFSLITIFTSLVNQAVDTRVWAAAIKFITQFREQGDYPRATAVVKLCYLVDFVTGVSSCLIVIASAALAAKFIVKDPSVTFLIQVYALSLLVATPVGTSTALVRMANRFDWLAYQQSGVMALRLLGTLIVLPLGFEILGVLIVFLFAGAAGSVWILLLAARTAKRLRLRSSREAPLRLLRGHFSELVRFLGATNLQSICKVAQSQLSVLLVGYWLNASAVGFYQLANKIVGILNVPVGPLTASSYPEFTRLWHQGRTRELRQLLGKLTLTLTGVAVVALVTLLLLGHWIVLWTAGAEFLPAAPILRWLAVGMSIAVASNCGGPLLLALGRSASYLVAMLAGVAIQFTLLFVLVPKYGAIGAAMGFVGFYVGWLAVVFVSAGRSLIRPTPNRVPR